jgi:hypothetical protein
MAFVAGLRRKSVITIGIACLVRHILHYFGVAFGVLQEYCYPHLVLGASQNQQLLRERTRRLQRRWRSRSIV